MWSSGFHRTNWRTRLKRDRVRGLEPKRAGRTPVKDAKKCKIEHDQAKLERELGMSREVID